MLTFKDSIYHFATLITFLKKAYMASIYFVFVLTLYIIKIELKYYIICI